MKKLIKLSSYVLALFALSFMTSCGDDGGDDGGETNPTSLTYVNGEFSQEDGNDIFELVEAGTYKIVLSSDAADYSKGTISSVSTTASDGSLQVVDTSLGMPFTDLEGSYDAATNKFGNIVSEVSSVDVGTKSITIVLKSTEKGDSPITMTFAVQ